MKEKKKNVKKIGQFLQQVSQEVLNEFPSTLICEVVYIYVTQKIYTFSRNQHSSFGDTEG